ncbi:MAG TPA: phospholipase D-like domain-containing protein [Streptosporangiaceae bacterium]|jgi:phosphatidylserine/phosphatidylglycerophosphate/cardiolipin synthase-like enzyme
MANTSAKGSVTGENGAGLGGLVVAAYDAGVIGDDRLGYVNTDAAGGFTVTYAARARPDLVIRVFDPVGRLLFESEAYPNSAQPLFDIGQIVIPHDVARGWRVTLRTGYLSGDQPAPPADPYPRLSAENLVTTMIDNELAWSELTQAVLAAKELIHLTQLWFDVGHLMTLFDPPMPVEGMPTGGKTLEDVLVKRNRDEHVAVRILLNHITGDPGIFDSLRDVRTFLDGALPNSVDLRGLRRPYNNPMHAKLAIIDGKTAYLLGSPFIQGYYDGNGHQIMEPRRGTPSVSRHTDNTPLHDVSVAVTGPAAAAVNDTFAELWNAVSDGPGITKSAPVPSADVNAAVQIVRTLPAGLVPSAPDGEAGILEAYLRAIGEAQEFIFLDNQYFTEVSMADALTRALIANDGLEVIMIVNGKVDLPFYNSLQPDLIVSMYEALEKRYDELKRKNDPRAAKGDLSDRLGVFTLWSHDAITTPQRPQQQILRGYTHAKTAIVDDKWATIGSANLDGVSLHLSQHVIPPVTRRDRREERAVEVNAVIFNGVHGLPGSTVPAEFRRALWAEHLGLKPDDLVTRPATGWLPLWKERAQAKLNGLTQVPPVATEARVLPWRPKGRHPGNGKSRPWELMAPSADPLTYLQDLGVTPDVLADLKVRSGGPSFNFGTGRWRREK